MVVIVAPGINRFLCGNPWLVCAVDEAEASRRQPLAGCNGERTDSAASHRTDRRIPGGLHDREDWPFGANEEYPAAGRTRHGTA